MAQLPPAEEETLQQKVTALVDAFPLTRLAGDGADVCIVINAPNKTYSYRVFKNAGFIEVAPSPFSTYCANDINDKGPEDLVIQYVDYDSFLDHYRDPSCQNVKESGAGEDFYYLESEFVQKGGMPVCNGLFQERYCPAVRQCLSNAEMRLSGLGCCAERRLFEIPGGFSSIYLLVALAIILAAIFISTMVIVKRRDMVLRPGPRQEATPELRSYVQKALSLGYSREQVEAHLHQLGWPKETVDAVFTDVLSNWLVQTS